MASLNRESVFYLYIGEDLFDAMEKFPKGFQTTVGITIICGLGGSGLRSDRIILGDDSRGSITVFPSVDLKIKERLIKALTELGNHNIDFDQTWTIFGEYTLARSNPRLAFKFAENGQINYIISIPRILFDWLLFGGFTATNGIKFKISLFKPTKITMNTVIINFVDVGRAILNSLQGLDPSKLDSAIQELNQTFQDDSEEGLVIYIPPETFDRKKFIASNGIVIMCDKKLKTGFGNGVPNTLFLDKTFRGREVLFTKEFPGWRKFKRRYAEISLALQEFRNK